MHVAKTLAPRMLMWSCVLLAMVPAVYGGTVLGPPQNFALTSGVSSLTAHWQPLGDPAVAEYLVYYAVGHAGPPYDGTGAAEGNSPIVVSAQTSSLVLTGLSQGKVVYAAVAAADANGEPGALSRGGQGALCDVLTPAAPVGVQASIVGHSIQISWTPNKEVDAYATIIYRGVTPLPTDSIGMVVLPGSVYQDPISGPGTWYYRLKATDYCELHSNFSDVVTASIPGPGPMVRGDVDANGEINISDPIYNLDYQFGGGPAPACLDAADDDDSGEINISDPIYSLNYQFGDGAPEPPPFPPTPNPMDYKQGCGYDPTPDTLTCVIFAPCLGDATTPVAARSPGSERVLLIATRSTVLNQLSVKVQVQTSVPLRGFESSFSYDRSKLAFVRFDKNTTVGKWDFISARASDAEGLVRLGAVPDFHLQRTLAPGSYEVGTLVFTARGGARPGVAARVAGGLFVARDRRLIVPLVDTPLAGVGSEASSPVRLEASFANPYRANSIILLRGITAGSTAQARVYSADGRMVRDLFHGPVDGNQITLSWDGRTGSGRRAEGGLYYVRVQTGQESIARKLLLLF